jgi:hypothetical protein
MVGLPGQTPETCRRDLQFLFDRKVFARLYITNVLPNAPMADPEYIQRHGISMTEDGFIEATSSFTREDFDEMCGISRFYKLFANPRMGILRYLAYFLQVEHGVDALDFVTGWMTAMKRDGAGLPVSQDLFRRFSVLPTSRGSKALLTISWSHVDGEALFPRMRALMDEVAAYCSGEFQIDLRRSDARAVMEAQAAVVPGAMSELRHVVPLEHDVVGYFADLRKTPNVRTLPEGFSPLRERKPGTLERQPRARKGLAYNDYHAPLDRFELPSNLSL